jgi:hypothetical protein
VQKESELLTLAVAAETAATTWYIGGAGGASATALGPMLSTYGLSATEVGEFETLVASGISTGIKYAGGLAINALIPPPAVRLSSTPQSYMVSGAANNATAFSVIPKSYGARQIFPQYAASRYTAMLQLKEVVACASLTDLRRFV